MDIKGMFDTWVKAITKPKQTFSSEKSKADFGKGAQHILIAGVIVGIISGAWAAYGFGGASVFASTFVSGIVGQFLGWIIAGGIFYLFAKLLGGKGTFTTQIYLMALYMAPLAVISSILGLVPYVGSWISLLVMIYGLYLLTLALKEAHNYTMGRAVLTWLIPVILLAVIFVILMMVAVALFSSLLGSSLLGSIPVA